MAGRHRAGSGRRGRFLRQAVAVAVPSLGVVALAAAVAVVGSMTITRPSGRSGPARRSGPTGRATGDRATGTRLRASAPAVAAPAQHAGRPGPNTPAAPDMSVDSGGAGDSGDSLLLLLRRRLEQDPVPAMGVRAAGPALSLLGR